MIDPINTNAQAATSAAQIQGQSTREALDFQKQKLAEEDARLAPYRALGGNATARLGSLWGLSSTTAPGVNNPATPLAPGPAQAQVKIPATPVTPDPPMTLSGLGIGGVLSSTRQPSPGAPNRPAQLGETRSINGQAGQWDGTGWVAM